MYCIIIILLFLYCDIYSGMEVPKMQKEQPKKKKATPLLDDEDVRTKNKCKCQLL